jgi:hypothetical protein
MPSTLRRPSPLVCAATGHRGSGCRPDAAGALPRVLYWRGHDRETA